MDDNDDWLISSLERYEQLFMYDLSTLIHLMQISHNNEGVWVYGQSSGNKKELLFLTLPGKITDKCITGGRDFKISKGAIVPYSVTALQEICNQKIIVSNNEKGTLHWWQEDIDNPDLLVEMASVTVNNQERPISYMDWMSNNNHQIVLGQHNPGLIQLYDMTSQTVLWENKLGIELYGVHYCDNNEYVLVSCQGVNGTIQTHDIRMTSSDINPITTLESCSKHNQYVFSSSSVIIGTLSNHGQIVLYDIRKSITEPYYSLQLPVTINSSHINLTISPDNTTLGISGLTPGISIHDTTIANHHIPVFTHDGHEKEAPSESVTVQAHLWHPNISRLLLSAGSDGGLHAWQYNVKF